MVEKKSDMKNKFFFTLSFLDISRNEMQTKSIKIKIDKKFSSKKKFII